MRTMSAVALLCAISFASFAQAQAQDANPSSPGQPAGSTNPDSPKDRVWYPDSNVYDPSDILGLVFIVEANNVLRSVHPPMVRADAPPVTVLKNDTAWHFSRTDKQQAEGSIPFIALTASVSSDHTQEGQIVDVATRAVGKGAYTSCEIWKAIRDNRDWKEGDAFYYIWRTTLSTVSWKIGKKDTQTAKFALGDYFSAGGSQYDLESTSAVVPAISYETIEARVTKADLRGKCPTGSSRLLKLGAHQVIHPSSVAPGSYIPKVRVVR